MSIDGVGEESVLVSDRAFLAHRQPVNRPIAFYIGSELHHKIRLFEDTLMHAERLLSHLRCVTKSAIATPKHWRDEP